MPAGPYETNTSNKSHKPTMSLYGALIICHGVVIVNM